VNDLLTNWYLLPAMIGSAVGFTIVVIAQETEENRD